MPTLENDSRLFVKSYFSNSVEEAMDRAHKELGPDALLLNTRESPPEARHLGECEVVFGVQRNTSIEPGVMAALDPVSDLRQRMEELREMVFRMGPAAEREAARTTIIEGSLVDAGISRPLAAEVDTAVQRRLRGSGVVQFGRPKSTPDWTREHLMRETLSELESRFQTAPELGRVTALVGPPGAGKTSVLVKLAISQGLMKKRPVRLISMDHHRIAAAEQLRTYATILGVSFTLVETTLALAQAIDSAPPDALVLIDTAGYTAASLWESGQELAAFLSSRQEIDTHLVLTATMRLPDLQRIVDLFQVFRPAKLLFTRLDETDCTSAMFCEASRTGKPLSFFSTGQVVPEDLESATKNRITSSLVKELPQAWEAVA